MIETIGVLAVFLFFQVICIILAYHVLNWFSCERINFDHLLPRLCLVFLSPIIVALFIVIMAIVFIIVVSLWIIAGPSVTEEFMYWIDDITEVIADEFFP